MGTRMDYGRIEKVARAPSIQIQMDARTCITEDNIEIECKASQLLETILQPLNDS